jgi:predicted pyridoxine 5'-phosphate oxidase superfamily flavin-nucleotide-binding protein
MLRCELSTVINVAVRDFNRGHFSGARFQPPSMLRCEISTVVNVAVRDFSRDQFSGARFQPPSMLRCEISTVISVAMQYLTLYRLTPVPLTASAVCPGVCVVTVGAGLLAKALVQSPLSSLANRIPSKPVPTDRGVSQQASGSARH